MSSMAEVGSEVKGCAAVVSASGQIVDAFISVGITSAYHVETHGMGASPG